VRTCSIAGAGIFVIPPEAMKGYNDFNGSTVQPFNVFH